MSLLQFGVLAGIDLFMILIILILVLIIPFYLAYWIYKDATKRGNDEAVLWALAAGLLTLFTFIGGFVVLTVYILQRD